MQLCSECKKNAAVLYISAAIDGKPKMRGLCLKCAKKLGVPGIDRMLKSQGVTDENIDAITDKINQSMQSFENGIAGLNSSLNTPEFQTSFIDAMKNLFENSKNIPVNDENPDEEDKSRPESYDEEDESEDYEEYEDDDSGFYQNIDRIFGQDDSSYKDPYEREYKKAKMKTINKYGTSLTGLAREGRLDPVIGREKEISRLTQILNRRSKNNPVLLGEPGVGKTAIAEGLAQKIVSGEISSKLKDYEVIQLEMGSLVAGTQFRGQFESRINNIIEEASANGRVILVIDELHSIMGAGEVHGGSLDAANILKPALAKGKIQIIGSTTMDEYRKFIEKDKALERRFQPIKVEEPNVDDSIEILKGLRSRYEEYHKVRYSDEVIKSAVMLSKKYINDRFLPDKAIDIIDEAGSKANLENTALARIKEIKDKLVDLKADELKYSQDADYEKAADCKQQEIKLDDELKLLGNDIYKIITNDDVARVVEQWTKIPASSISEGESQKLMKLESTLKKRIIGQDKAVDAVSKAIRRNRAGISTVKRPASFLFIGPTGVGKTQLVKELAAEMFGTADSIIKLDMSEYMEKHSVSKLIGSPPGYVGYDDAGQLTDRVRRRPYSIVLFDEIEKAHPDVFNMLLQIMEDGVLTDSQGQTVHFENCLIIMTGNIGTTFKNKTLGFAASEQDMEETRIKDALKDSFKPEFLNRLDEIVIFNKLGKEELIKIIDIMIGNLQEVLVKKGIHLIVTPEVKEFLIENATNETYGARPLRRAIQKYIEDEIADMIITKQDSLSELFAKVNGKKVAIEPA